MVENGTYDGARVGVRTGARGAVRYGLAAGTVALATLLAGCSHLHWPWHRKPPPPPPQVHELDESSDGGASASFPQYWMRNTLVVDLQSASGSGSVTLKPREHTMWPVRIALKVVPGSVGEIEIRANQRVVLPVTTSGVKPVVLELSPRTYTMKTPQIVVSWGPMVVPAS
ncbi:MAG TPA: hypothetical protein VGC34_06990 [Steroidobacteraceae bacterium]